MNRNYNPQTPLKVTLASQAKKILYNILYGILGTAIFILIWKMSGNVIFNRPGYEQFNAFLPESAIRTFGFLILKNHFWGSVLASLKRIAIGILVAFIIGFPSGLLFGFYPGCPLRSSFSQPLNQLSVS